MQSGGAGVYGDRVPGADVLTEQLLESGDPRARSDPTRSKGRDDLRDFGLVDRWTAEHQKCVAHDQPRLL